MAIIHNAWVRLLANKAWIFSGVGVAVLTWLLNLWFSGPTPPSAEKNTPPQGNVVVSGNMSNSQAIIGDHGTLTVRRIEGITPEIHQKIVDEPIDILTRIEGADRMKNARDILDQALERRDRAPTGAAQALAVLLAEDRHTPAADLSALNLAGLSLEGVNFVGSTLDAAILTDARLSKSNLSKANAQFLEAESAQFLDGSVLDQLNAPFLLALNARFPGAHIRRANLIAADLRNVDFRKADLSNTVLAFSDLRGADLTGANLSGAFIIGADLTETVLEGTKFDQTSAVGAILSPDHLSEKQLLGLCQHSILFNRNGRKPDYSMRLFERWSDPTMPSGHRGTDLTKYEKFGGHVPQDASRNLPFCDTDPGSIASFNAHYPNHLKMVFEQSLLTSAGLKPILLRRLKTFSERQQSKLVTALRIDLPLRLRQEPGKDVSITPQEGKPILFNGDTLLVWLLSNGVVHANEVDWNKAARYRLSLEIARSQETFLGGMIDATPLQLTAAWPAFFPRGLRWVDVGAERVVAYRAWTEGRAGRGQLVMTLQAIGEVQADGKHAIVSLITPFSFLDNTNWIGVCTLTDKVRPDMIYVCGLSGPIDSGVPSVVLALPKWLRSYKFPLPTNQDMIVERKVAAEIGIIFSNAVEIEENSQILVDAEPVSVTLTSHDSRKRVIVATAPLN